MHMLLGELCELERRLLHLEGMISDIKRSHELSDELSLVKNLAYDIEERLVDALIELGEPEREPAKEREPERSMKEGAGAETAEKGGGRANLSPQAGRTIFRRGGWRKLRRVKNKGTRLLSLPASLIGRLGLDPHKELEGQWVVRGGRLILRIREARGLCGNGWRKLYRVSGSTTRVLSLPVGFITKLGIDPRKELEGLWVVERSHLILRIREARGWRGP